MLPISIGAFQVRLQHVFSMTMNRICTCSSRPCTSGEALPLLTSRLIEMGMPDGTIRTISYASVESEQASMFAPPFWPWLISYQYSVGQGRAGQANKMYMTRCLHVDESGHDDGVPIVDVRPPEHEAAVVPDGDGVDESPFDLHCRQQRSHREREEASASEPEPSARSTRETARRGRTVPAAGPTRPSVTTRSLAIQKWSCGRRLHPSPPKLCNQPNEKQ